MLEQVFVFKCWTTEGSDGLFSTLHSSKPNVHMAGCLFSAFMISKSLAESGKSWHYHHKNVPILCIWYISKQRNQCRIYTRQCLKITTWCGNYIVIFCSFKGPSCCDCHMPLATEMCFSCFSSHWMSNISYWGSQIHLMIFPPYSNGNGACDKTVVLT